MRKIWGKCLLNDDSIGIKQIPNVLNEGTPSEPKMTARPKPWETNKQQQQEQEQEAVAEEATA